MNPSPDVCHVAPRPPSAGAQGEGRCRGPSLRPRLATVPVLLLASALFLPGCEGDHPGPSPAMDGPEDGHLLVFVVVDQLRGDLLDRYAELFGGGFARLQDEGRRWTDATFDHAQTATTPGHATAATGVHPHRHGLVANNWEQRTADGGWETVYALRDLDSPLVGAPGLEGRGPANLLREGLPDWLLQAHPGSRVVSLSGKDRSAIAMAGRTRGEVYWFEEAVGRFVTSTWYREDIPGWVEDFHREPEGLARSWSDTIWRSTVPEEARHLSRPDTFAFEGDGVNTYFPHRFSREGGIGPEASPEVREDALHRWRARTPFLDAATLDLARRAVTSLELGQRREVDYLAIALSQADRVGHDYGPLSREQMDNLLRLDGELGAFLDFLDREVGEGAWTLALTADHGTLELPEARPALGLHGRRISPDERRELIRTAESAAAAAGEDPLERARAAAQAALEVEWVEDAFAWADVLAETPADSLRLFFTRSWHPDRVIGHLGRLGVAYRMPEGVYDGRYPFGTGHGTPYHHDRHVPMAILGPGVRPGTVEAPASVVDLAPTLAALLGIPAPDDLDGVPLPLP